MACFLMFLFFFACDKFKIHIFSLLIHRYGAGGFLRFLHKARLKLHKYSTLARRKCSLTGAFTGRYRHSMVLRDIAQFWLKTDKDCV